MLCLQMTWTDSQSRGGGAVCQSKGRGGGQEGGHIGESAGKK